MLGYPAAEHTWALILALVKQVSAEDSIMHEGGWQQGLSTGLRTTRWVLLAWASWVPRWLQSGWLLE
ncbi:MAG: hypothetical protein Ct9H300mP16_00660 [Pseudomonadota bacterium]|nr:MAG: hypothetical protein Ct9H300mP16_00660 [Pseudomonadota bacterium]